MIFCQSISSLLLLAFAVSVNAECGLNWLAAKNLSDWQMASDQSTSFTSCDLLEDTVSIDLKKLLSDVSCIKRVNVQTNQREVESSNPSDVIVVRNVFEANCTQDDMLRITVEDLSGRRLSLKTTFDPVDCFRDETLAFKVEQSEKVINLLSRRYLTIYHIAIR